VPVVVDRLPTTGGSVATPSQRVIVVVDDESSIRQYVRAVLEQYQEFQIVEAVNGQEGLAVVERLGTAVGLIITDIEMDPVDGLSMMRSVRQALPEIPVIFMSAYTGMPVGRNEPFLYKPFLPATLLAAVRKVLDCRTAS